MNVVQQRRAYKHIKSALKAKGIRFQSPFTNLRIHWDTGPRLYHTPMEAAREMRNQGIEVIDPRIAEVSTRLSCWINWRAHHHGNASLATEIRELSNAYAIDYRSFNVPRPNLISPCPTGTFRLFILGLTINT